MTTSCTDAANCCGCKTLIWPSDCKPARRSRVVNIRRTYSAEGNKSVLPRVDGAVVGPVAPHVRGAVDQPGGVEHNRVSEEGRDEIRHPQRLAPHVPRHDRRHEEAHQQHGHLVVPATVQSNSVKTVHSVTPLWHTKRAQTRLLWNITTSSAFRSLISSLRPFSMTSGCLRTSSQPMWEKKNPRTALWGSASVSEYLWWTRWSRAHS